MLERTCTVDGCAAESAKTTGYSECADHASPGHHPDEATVEITPLADRDLSTDDHRRIGTPDVRLCGRCWVLRSLDVPNLDPGETIRIGCPECNNVTIHRPIASHATVE